MVASNRYRIALDELVMEKSLLTHPFYQAWSKGTLTKESLRDYAAQYFHHVKAFPTYLSALHSHTTDDAVRKHVFENLVDEEAGEVNHPELWLRFAEGLGLSREEVEGAELWNETQSLIDTFKEVCLDRTEVEGLAGLYAYESQIPEIATTKIEGLKSYYGIEDARTISYFVVHEEADKEHSAVERDLLETRLTAETEAGTRQAVSDVTVALWEMLSGVARRHDIPLESEACM